MPKKKKGKGKGKKKGKGRKGKGKDTALEKGEILKKTKDLLKNYSSLCSLTGCGIGAFVFSAIKHCVEEEKPLIKIVLDPQRATNERKKMNKQKGGAQTKDTLTTIPSEKSQMDFPPVRISPLLRCLTELDYIYLRCIHVWVLQLDEPEMVELSKFMESKAGHEIRVLELIRNSISTWSLCRLCRTFPLCQLVHITLDYNRIDDEGIRYLCTNLLNNFHLNSLNLNYCNLSSSCCDSLGTLASSTQLRHLSVQGNRLRAKGVRILLQNLTSISEVKESMPLLGKLFLQDNEIDGCGEDGIYGPVACMEMMRRWIASCKVIEEVRLDGNLIGDSAAREVLIGLKCRKEAGYPSIQLSLTHCINSELFLDIKNLSATKKGKKGKGKKKGKKKK